MKASKTLASLVAAAAVAGSIGLAYAQATRSNATGWCGVGLLGCRNCRSLTQRDGQRSGPRPNAVGCQSDRFVPEPFPRLTISHDKQAGRIPPFPPLLFGQVRGL